MTDILKAGDPSRFVVILDGNWQIVYEPAAVVYHSENYTPNGLFKRYFHLGVIWKQFGMWDETSRQSPEDYYGIAKLAVEQKLKASHEVLGLDYIICRPHND